MSIERADTSSVDEIHSLIWKAVGANLPPSRLIRDCLDSDSDVFIYRQHGKAAGVIFGRHHDNLSTIECLAVDPELRHHGVATELVRHFLCACDDRGCSSLCQIEVKKDNDEAMQLYRDCGFKVTGNIRRCSEATGSLVGMTRPAMAQ